MSTIDLHEKPFSEETITKLSIFEDYAKAWIPTFVMAEWSCEMNIFDFFAGTGYDKNNIAGSSIRILTQVSKYIGNIFAKKKRINIYINELDFDKYNQLVNACNGFVNSNADLKRCVDSKFLNIIYTNKDCEEIFDIYFEKINQYPSLVYLDQNGVKFLADKYFNKLSQSHTVDFLYFISSSYFLRFGNTEEFKKILDIDLLKAKENPYKYIHQFILEKLREKIPKTSKTELYPFTIKKGTNIYGIIFGASHPRAVDKFLNITWKTNATNGNANFDIDDDKSKNTFPDLFGCREYTKIQSFQENVKQNILSGKLRTNKEVYLYTLKNGHIAKHSEEVVKQMKKNNLIDYKERSPLINYDQAIKKDRIIEYKIKKIIK